MTTTEQEPAALTMAAFIFEGFETLDLYGPLEMLGSLPGKIEVVVVSETGEPMSSVQGQRLMADRSIHEESDYELLFVPGGDSALEVMKDPSVVEWLTQTATRADLVMTVCTGSILLGSTGLLDGRQATTNKQDFLATIGYAPNVEWVRQARWVEDGKYFTSSGVSAGIDMSLAVIAKLFGRQVAERMAAGCEYEWHDDPTWDPFAVAAGLV